MDILRKDTKFWDQDRMMAPEIEAAKRVVLDPRLREIVALSALLWARTGPADMLSDPARFPDDIQKRAQCRRHGSMPGIVDRDAFRGGRPGGQNLAQRRLRAGSAAGLAT